MAIVNLSEIMREKAKHPNPCEGCEAGIISISQWTDPATGDSMQETKDCHDDCEGKAYKRYVYLVGTY